MTLPLTPHILAGCYDFLRTTPPYRRWKLPESDAVEFGVTRNGKSMAAHRAGDTHLIEVSAGLVGITNTLVWVMGHEMIHMYQAFAGLETHNTVHNADFRRKAEQACRYHGWDYRLFV